MKKSEKGNLLLENNELEKKKEELEKELKKAKNRNKFLKMNENKGDFFEEYE